MTSLTEKIAKKEPDRRLNENGRENFAIYNEDGQFAGKDNLNKSYKYQNLMGDALLAGAGVGLSWYAIKKLVERAYRKKLHKALLEDTTVQDTYEGRVTPVGNEFVNADAPAYKYSSLQKEAKSPSGAGYKSLNTGTRGYLRETIDDPAVDAVIVKKDYNPRTTMAVEMAKHPAISHSLAFASIPALFALSSWLANSGSKSLFQTTLSDTVPPLSSEKSQARKEYEAAAAMLRSIARGDLEKSGSAGLKKEGVWFVPLLAAGGGAAAALGGSYYLRNRDNPKPIDEQSPDANPNPMLNSAINLGLGLGAIALLYPGYKFVQSMRKGYKDRTETVSDVHRALQAWDAQRQARDEDFATLRAALAQEPDLLEKYFNPDGTLKRNLQIT